MTPSRVLVWSIALGVTAASWLGCSNDSGPSARVALNSTLGSSSAHPQDVCKLSPAPWITIGAVGNQVAPGSTTVPVNNGEAWNGHTVTADCSVTADGDGFQVQASVSVDTVGSFSVSGRFTTTGPITPVQGIFQRGDTGSFKQDNCTVTYPRPDEMKIAGGRVWAQIDCPDATFEAQNRICHAQAEFRFENCGGG